MKIQVTLNSIYKWALVEETYLVDVTEDEVLDYFGANSIDDISTNELGQLALNGYGQLESKTLLDSRDCKGDTITTVEVLQ